MTTEQKIEGNRLIAEFMGFIPKKSELGNTYTHPDKMGVYGGVGMKFKYHSSWDWLMPVWHRVLYGVLGGKHDLDSEQAVERFSKYTSWQKKNAVCVMRRVCKSR